MNLFNLRIFALLLAFAALSTVAEDSADELFENVPQVFVQIMNAAVKPLEFFLEAPHDSELSKKSTISIGNDFNFSSTSSQLNIHVDKCVANVGFEKGCGVHILSCDCDPYSGVQCFLEPNLALGSSKECSLRMILAPDSGVCTFIQDFSHALDWSIFKMTSKVEVIPPRILGGEDGNFEFDMQNIRISNLNLGECAVSRNLFVRGSHSFSSQFRQVELLLDPVFFNFTRNGLLKVHGNGSIKLSVVSNVFVEIDIVSKKLIHFDIQIERFDMVLLSGDSKILRGLYKVAKGLISNTVRHLGSQIIANIIRKELSHCIADVNKCLLSGVKEYAIDIPKFVIH